MHIQAFGFTETRGPTVDEESLTILKIKDKIY